MTFLEPLLLWGLPLALVPVVIHLFNRLRHRSLDWAAMMFLLSANRKSTRYQRLRQWLILLFRVLALAALILAVCRPLAGGWIGWMLHPAPDAILMVLDRSSSMETKLNGGQATKRDEALRLFAQAAKGYEGVSRLILLETALRNPQELGDANALSPLSLTAPTDTAADIPATLQTALDWMLRNRPGAVEIWLASDLQRGNWQPDSERWPALATQLAALPQSVRVRLLALNQSSAGENVSLALEEINRRARVEPPELELVMNLERGSPAAVNLPLSVTTDGNRAYVDLAVQGQTFRYRHKLVLDSSAINGWGKVELPADANLRDNTAYFVYGPPQVLRTAVVATNPIMARYLQLAAAPAPADTNRVAEGMAADKLEAVNWLDYALVLWQGAAPQGEIARRLLAFVEAGGNLVMFPAGVAGRFEGAGWGEAESAEIDRPWKINRWDEKDGPLAKTEEGLSLPLNDLNIQRRQVVNGGRHVLAAFEDGGRFLVRQIAGKGQILVCATAPGAEWSNLDEGTVLVPLVQRALQAGGRRFTQAGMWVCGQTSPSDGGEKWLSTDSPGKDFQTQAGVYRSANRLVAVNRPESENDLEVLEAAKARALFGSVPVQLFEEKGRGEAKLQSELWRAFLFVMLAFLLGEAMLILPPKSQDVETAQVKGKGGGAR